MIMRTIDESSEGASDSKINAYSYIRWSSQPQTWGDSERRQLQEHQDWAARRGLKLSERTFADRGVSAKAGKNLSEGALGELVKIAKPGDIILLEEHDRFSRQNPLDAMLNLREIVNRGVNLVFTKTNLEVTRANFNEMHVLFKTFFRASPPTLRTRKNHSGSKNPGKSVGPNYAAARQLGKSSRAG
jgi:hypothetical protein